MICEFKGEFDFLSSFFPVELTLTVSVDDGKEWRLEEVTVPTLEHFFQGSKCTTWEDFDRVISCKTPGQSKRMGRKVKIREDWDEVKVQVMRDLIEVKFSHGSELGQMLVDTWPHDLVEGNKWHDTFWGVDLRTFKGENWLGRLLMQRRDELRQT